MVRLAFMTIGGLLSLGVLMEESQAGGQLKYYIVKEKILRSYQQSVKVSKYQKEICFTSIHGVEVDGAIHLKEIQNLF